MEKISINDEQFKQIVEKIKSGKELIEFFGGIEPVYNDDFIWCIRTNDVLPYNELIKLYNMDSIDVKCKLCEPDDNYTHILTVNNIYEIYLINDNFYYDEEFINNCIRILTA